RWGNHLESRDHHAPVFDTLAVLRAETRTGAISRTHHERAFDLAVRHITALGKFIRNVIEADRKEIREHDFGNRFQAGHCRAHSPTENGQLGYRSVAPAQRSELLVQANGRLEYPAGLGYVLSEEDHVGVAFHLLRDTADDRVAIGQFRHAQPPSA